MHYRYLGDSGLKISELTLGNWLTHGGEVDEDTAIATVNAAWDAGISSFDTADVYANGAAETVLGKALSPRRRESVEIFTKVYFPVGPHGHNDTGLSRKHILESINSSLRRLRTDHVDLYQAHRYDYETPLPETMQAFADVVRAGKALYIGVSEWTAEQLQAGHDLADQLGFQLVSVQPQYSALWRVPEGKVIPAAQRLGMSLVVFSPLAQGVLTGKYLPGEPAPAGSRATDQRGGGAQFISRFLREDVLRAVQNLKPIAAGLGITLAQLGLAWVLHNPAVAAALIGASRPQQVAENAKAADVTLSDDAWDAVNAALVDVARTDPQLTYGTSPKTRLV